MPTLVADGTADKLDPVANRRKLPNAKLQLDRNGIFLFQEQTSFVPLIERVLG
jgi:hypothetical protein